MPFGSACSLRLARLCLRRVGPKWGWLLIPFLWTGLEYFRSELYYLRFSWLNTGYAFAGAPWQGGFKLVGVYGVGFLLVSLAAVAAYLWQTVQSPGFRFAGSRRRRRLPRGIPGGHESPTQPVARVQRGWGSDGVSH